MQVLDERHRQGTGIMEADRFICCACNHVLYCTWVEHDDEGKTRQSPILSPSNLRLLCAAPHLFIYFSVLIFLVLFSVCPRVFIIYTLFSFRRRFRADL